MRDIRVVKVSDVSDSPETVHLELSVPREVVDQAQPAARAFTEELIRDPERTCAKIADSESLLLLQLADLLSSSHDSQSDVLERDSAVTPSPSTNRSP